MVTIKKHVAVHSGCHQSKVIHGSHHALMPYQHALLSELS